MYSAVCFKLWVLPSYFLTPRCRYRLSRTFSVSALPARSPMPRKVVLAYTLSYRPAAALIAAIVFSTAFPKSSCAWISMVADFCFFFDC